jgi:hypothetical protein
MRQLLGVLLQEVMLASDCHLEELTGFDLCLSLSTIEVIASIRRYLVRPSRVVNHSWN